MTAANFISKIKSFFSFNRLFLLIFFITIIFRFAFLDLKLFHHDEAIHAWFSWELLTTGTWQYDPMYHGPFLYFITAGMFSIFGDSDLVARLAPTLFGSLLIPLVYCIYRLGYLDRKQTLIASIFIALSPDMIYFSRFLRHDIFMLFFTLLLIVGLLAYFEKKKTRYIIISAVALACALSLKEEMPIIALIIGLYFIYALFRRKTFTLPTTWTRDLILGVLVVVSIMSILYSGFGAHIETLIGQNLDLHTTGWYKAIEHWTAMHNQQRLGGPWYFYILLLILYEVPILILALIGTIQFLISGEKIHEMYHNLRNRIRPAESPTAFHLLIKRCIFQINASKKPVDIGINKQEEFVRFCIVWMLLSMGVYAYVGEKVPWLVIHQLLPMIFVAVYKLNKLKIIGAILGCIFLVLITWHVAFVPADVNEPIVQVQNSEQMRDVMKLIDASDHVVLASKNYWPLPWYYRGEIWKKKITFYGKRVDETTLFEQKPDLIIFHDAESYNSLPGYDKKTYRLSYWFSVWDNQDRLAEYYFKRDGPLGSMNLDIFIRNASMTQ